MWNRVDPSRHEMVPRYKHAIKHEMRLVLLAKLLLSELRVLITEYYWCKFAVPWSTWRAETCQDNPNLVTQFLAGYTDGNPDAKDCRLTLWAIFVVHRLTGASVKRETLSPLLTQHKHRSHRNFHIILYRSVWEIWMSPHFWWWTLNGIQQPQLCSQQHPATIVVLLLYVICLLSYQLLALVNDCQKMPKAGASLSMTLPVGRVNFKIRDCSRKLLITGGDPAAPARKCMEAQSVWEFWWFRGPWLKHV